MLMHRSLFQIVSIIVIVSTLFSGFQFVPVSAQENADYKPALLEGAWYVAMTGNDSNSCTSAGSPCKTINGALGKAAFGDTIRIAIGTYTGTGPEVVLIDKSITLSGGWNAAFTIQSGRSTVDGRDNRRGITVTAGDVLIDRFTIQNGRERFGGGLMNENGPLMLSNSILTQNASEWMGGGIYNISGTLTIRNTTISGNTAGKAGASGGGGGGGIQNNGGTLILENSTVSGNTLLGWYHGSGIHNQGVAIIENSTISGNSAGTTHMFGGGEGIYNSDFLLLNNSTIAFNGVLGFMNSGGEIHLSNTILAGHVAGRDCYNYWGRVQSQRYNLIGNGYGCNLTSTPEDLIGSQADPIDPLLGPLQDNGGPTPTHALGLGSPAIDAGEPDFLGRGEFFCRTTDQRGVTRPQGARCDIGAYEVEAPISIHIGGMAHDSHFFALEKTQRVQYPGVTDGPVYLSTNDGTQLVASQRVIYKVKGVNTSLSEMMGLPNSQLDKTYWLPWYNNVDLDTQLRIANATNNPATVTVTIGGVAMPRLNLAAGESTRVSYPVNDGPVKIESDQNIVAAERVIYKVKGIQTSFSEMMALPEKHLDTTYWLSWYNNVYLDTQLRIGNVSNVTATVHIFIGGNEVTPAEGITLLEGESTRVSYESVDDGPVQIVSDQDIVAAERVIYKVQGVQTSFSEMMALPHNQLDATYWLPWYNNVDLDTQLRIGNVSNATATVHIFIGGDEVTPVEGITLLVGESTRLSFTSVNDGPVQIVSDQDIVAAERVIYKVNRKHTSFSEMMALPNTQLDTTYWFPWYNNIDLDTQLRFGVP